MSPGTEGPFDTAVIGAGISGLTTAFYLSRAGRKVTVLEAAAKVGGAIETRAEGGWLFELGPNTVLESNPSVRNLIADCGLEGERIEAAPHAKRRYVWKGDGLHPLPGSPLGFLTTPLFPAAAKLGLLRELWVRRPPQDTDETLADFVRRRLGQAFLDFAVGPFVSGVYAGDPERLSVRWAVPKIAALEREHGSLIRGALAKRRGPAPGGAMISFRRGLQELPRRLAEGAGSVRLGTPCRGLARSPRGFAVETEAGRLEASRVVLAVPADAAAQLLDGITGGAGRAFADIPYAPLAVVSLGFRRQDVDHPLDGFGFLAPRRESLRILGCLFPSSVFPDRAPEGHALLTAFAGGRTDPEVATWEDGEIQRAVLAELHRALGLSGDPVRRVLRRWPRAIPQYEVGHGRFVELAAEIEEAVPGLYIGGNFLRGVSVPDCIKNATALAGRLLQGGGGRNVG